MNRIQIYKVSRYINCTRLKFFQQHSVLFFLLLLSVVSYGQADSLSMQTDSISNDSINVHVNIEKSALEEQIDYQARDSILYYVKDMYVELYGEAVVDYSTIHLEAAYIRIDFKNFMILAYGMNDTNGVVQGIPFFKDGEQEFESDTISYNYETKKGIIQHIFTKQGDGFLHGDRVKKLEDNTILVRNGSFTTCSLKDPHFEIQFNKAKVIPDDKIVTGPVWLVIEGIPTPLALPFGFFPNKKGRASGILIPTYGESANRGFYLENGGYYFGLSDMVDLSVRGDIYSRGSWALKTESNYKKRYKYEGNLNVSYAVNLLGERNTSSFEKSKAFFIKWKHVQDPKARPNSRFSANVQLGSSDYNTYNPSSSQDYLSSNYSSSISYSTRIASVFNLTANLSQTQNTQTNTFSISLPDIALTSNRFYPFRSKKKSRNKFLESVNLSYSLYARNSLNTIDSLLFDNLDWVNFDNGVKHTVPVSSSFKLFKYVNVTNSIAYTQRWYFQSIEKHWNALDSSLVTDTIQGFNIAHDFSVSSSLSTKLYTFLSFKRGPISAFRHVLTPTVRFSWRPDFGEQQWGYYKYYITPGATEATRYSVFEGGIYGSPSAGKSMLSTFALSNNVEMKVRNRKDTLSGFKKIALIDDLTLSSSYNFAADSLNWAKVLLSGRTRLFKSLDLRYAATFDPYIVDSTGRNLNQFEWDVNDRLLRQNSGEWGVSLNWNLGPQTFKNKNKPIDTTHVSVVDKIPWSLNLAYTMQYIHDYRETSLEPKTFIQTISINGSINLTPNWRVSLMTNYNFVDHEFIYTSVNIYRDMHCWEINFNWIPTGFRKSYNMTIRVKSSILQDLKVTKKTDWRDYY